MFRQRDATGHRPAHRRAQIYLRKDLTRSRGLDLRADVLGFEAVEQVIEPCLGGQIKEALGVVGGGFIHAAATPGGALAFSSWARWAAKRTSAKRRKMRPRSPCGRPPLKSVSAKWGAGTACSAASPRRFSSAALFVSFSDGAIQIMVLGREYAAPNAMQFQTVRGGCGSCAGENVSNQFSTQGRPRSGLTRGTGSAGWMEMNSTQKRFLQG